MTLDDRIEETVLVKKCADGERTYFFQYAPLPGVCLIGKQVQCKLQGSLVDVMGRKYYVCTKYHVDKSQVGDV